MKVKKRRHDRMPEVWGHLGFNILEDWSNNQAALTFECLWEQSNQAYEQAWVGQCRVRFKCSKDPCEEESRVK